MVIQTCKNLILALRALEDAKIVHCDLKPENIVIAHKDQLDSVRLIDFGGATQEGQLGHTKTKQYASPEQLNAFPLTCKSDVYSMGLIIGMLIIDSLVPVELQSNEFKKFFYEQSRYNNQLWINALPHSSVLAQMLTSDVSKRLCASNVNIDLISLTIG